MALVRASMAMYDDGRIAGAAEAGSALAAGATSVGYSVERDQVPEVIADFRRALLELEDAADEASNHENVVPPGGDPHSRRVVEAMGPELVSDYLGANKRDQDNIKAMIENLDAAMRQYDAQDGEVARSFRPGV